MNRSSLQLFGRIALITVLVVLAIWLLRRFLPALAWAAVLAIASWPARQWLIDKGVRRSIAALLLTVLVGALIVGPLLVLAVQMAREAGALTVGIVTKPFLFEGRRRMKQAEAGINEMRSARRQVDYH